jgi:asparagine synthase (glutamine-hydrolysing)
MCGIVAAFRGSGLEEERVLPALKTLSHRGPDGQAVWFDRPRQIALGHARLSIMDPEGGQQPLFNEDRSLAAVVNGEFYGFEAIRAELESQGHTFRTRSDSEILLHLYEEHGTDCLRYLRGEFAFVLWDAKHERLFAARDRYGIKPLFYAEWNGTVGFASEIKALFALGAPARWNQRYLHDVMSLGIYAPGQSCFAGVETIEPGHFLMVSRQGIQKQKYWDCDYPADGDPSVITDPDFARQEVRQRLDDAVRTRLRSDVPVGFYLSGGIDSCAILGLAARALPHRPQAFTLSFERADYDELASAEEMARRCGAELHPVRVTSRDLAESFDEAVTHAELPLLNAHAVAKFRLSRAVRAAGYRVVLTGEGADETFGGYAFYKQDLIMSSLRGQAPEEARRRLRQLFDGNPASQSLLRLEAGPGLPAYERRLGYTPSQTMALAEAWPGLRPFLAPAFERAFAGRDAAAEFLDRLDLHGQLEGRSVLHQSLYLSAKTFLPGYILAVLGDRMEMANSLEGRTPFLDHHLTEFVRRLAPELKISQGVEKFILREAVRDLVPPAAYERRKHPFLAPPVAQASSENPLREMLRDRLSSRAARDLPFYDLAKLSTLLDQGLDRLSAKEQTQLEPLLMTAASLVALQERFGVEAGET